MNRLWMRLSLSFGVVVLLAVSLIIGIGILVQQANVPPPLLLDAVQAPGGVLDGLAAFYQTQPRWQGVDAFLSGAAKGLYPISGGRLAFRLLDADGQLLAQVSATSTREQAQDQVTSQSLVKKLTLNYDGQTRAYLEVSDREFSIPLGIEPFIRDRLRDFLILVAFVGGLGGIIFGVLMSRNLTAPLDRLATAAQAIGARDLSRRVQVTGSAEVVALAQSFNDMAAKLEQAETLRRNLVADVAHELRTPLSVLQGNLRAILDNIYPLEQAEVARLYDQTRLLSRLVSDLHDLTQAESHQLLLKLRQVDIVLLIKSAADAFAPLAEAESVRLNVDLHADLPLLMLDALRMTQVFHNLLVNALRHTPASGTITISAERLIRAGEPEQVQLTVRDTGEGIPAEHLPFVFERFYRADRARSRMTGGSGLGLAIVRAIVENHQGQISLASDGIPGHGTTFTIYLPVST